MRKYNDTLILAHYYTSPEVKAVADFVGDSLDLTMKAVAEKPKVIVFAGVRFMAETCKIMLPDTTVILPDQASTCSLVEMTNIKALKLWRESRRDHVHVAYINSSAEHKALADWIVTSRNVADIIGDLKSQGKKVMFSPDRNMGAYLNSKFGFDMPLWHAVCEVHDSIKDEEITQAFRGWTDGPKYLIAHPESVLPVLNRADYIGSTHGMLEWVKDFPYKVGTIFVATEEGLLYDMKKARPDLDIRCAPSYTGCQCAICPYMKKNTLKKVEKAAVDGHGFYIDYLTDELIERARTPIERMLEWQRNYSSGNRQS